MVLDSQSARRSGGIGYSRAGRRKRRGRQLIGAVIVLALITYFAWGYIFSSPKTTDAAPDTAADAPTTTHDGAPVASEKPSPIIDNLATLTETTKKIARQTPDVIEVGAVPVTPPPPPAPPVKAADQPPPAPPADGSEPPPVIRSGGEVARQIEAGRKLIADKQPVKAREALSAALKGEINAKDAEFVRDEITKVNQALVFSPAVEAGDPLSEVYVMQGGDLLMKVARPYKVPWEFLKVVNRIGDVTKIRQGARIKVVKGPFRVVVTKHEFRLDVWNGDLFIRSFPVGLGEFDSTPPGEWVVRGHSKLTNPPWINPRTSQRFEADDPKNPLGEYWIGLRGAEPATEKLTGYGIHGTIVPESIGTMASMGCVRLLPDDIKLLYAMLEEEQSRVTILK